MSLTILGLAFVLLSQFFPAEEIEVVIEAFGIILAWYGRFRHGDITLFGSKKVVK